MRYLILSIVTFTVLALSAVYAQQDAPAPRGPFVISSGSQNTAWRIDQGTGLVSYCQRDMVSNDPALIRSRPPVCSTWGQ
ncbi:MAG TPA: hypothetical protein VGF14_08150 [Alphaproteobacteria bacterium]